MNRNKQQGMGLLQLMIIIGIATVFITFGLKMFPVVMDNLAIKQSLEQIAREAKSQDGNVNTRALWNKLQKFNNINSINYIKKEHFIVEKTDNGVNFGVDYEVRKEFLYNFDIVAKFNNMVSAGRNYDY
jgi:hypothetical protein